jgi:hypothetical protein
LLFLSPAWSGVWIGAEIGPNFMTDTDVVFKFGRTSVKVNNLRFEP